MSMTIDSSDTHETIINSIDDTSNAATSYPTDVATITYSQGHVDDQANTTTGSNTDTTMTPANATTSTTDKPHDTGKEDASSQANITSISEKHLVTTIGDDVVSSISVEDQALIHEADEYYKNERYFKAAECLKKVKDRNYLTSLHHNIMESSDQALIGMHECMIPPDENILQQNGYHKQTEVHSTQFDTSIHYKVDSNTYQLTSRLESLLEHDLLIPLISVLNESDLYETWMPKFNFPFRLGITESKKLGEYGRGNQIILVTIQMPYPFCTRQVIQHAISIDTIDEHNAIMIQVHSVPPGKHIYDLDIDEPKKGIVRIDLEVSMLLRACPKDHPLYIKRMEKLQQLQECEEKKMKQQKKKTNRKEKSSKDDHEASEVETKSSTSPVENTANNDDTSNSVPPKMKLPSLLLVTALLQVDAHVKAVPQKVVNFFTRTALSSLWHSLLHVAQEVQQGKRPQHVQCINETNKDLYDWIKQRTDIMIAKLQQQWF
jgi:hypothetical protein